MSTNDTDIVKLNLNDTFYDWYLRTNQVIDYVNPINVYDVFAGSGLSETRTGTPGTVVFTVATNGALYGITTLANTQGIEEVVLDYNSLSASSVANDNVYSFQKAGDVIYKVEASDMLPPDLNGDHAFAGTITVGDLIVDDGNITINNTGSNRDNCGIVIQSTSDTDSSNVYFTYDETTSAWYSSQNLGLKQTKAFVTDSATTAIFPFVATETQAQVDIRLQTTTSGIPERFSINAEFDATNTLTFSHYSNNALISDILELTSTGTNGSSVVVKDTLTITDVLNSTPFSNTPAVTSVPVTDSTNGYLDKFVNRIKIVSADAGIAVGDFVYLNNSGEAVRTDPTNLQKTYQIGIVESISGSGVGAVLTIIVSGTIPSGLLTGLTAGSIYYLSETIGEVTSTNPEDTNGTIGKPVFIAASSTTGVLIPDFTNIGGGTTIIGGTGSIDNAFSTVTLLSGGSANASGETTLSIDLGTNLSGSIAGTTLTINCDIPEIASANRLLRRNNSNAYEWFAPSDFSVIAKPLSTGEITSVQLTPGTLLGRRDDDTDTDNPVEALSPTQVLDLLGFSSNSYLKNVIFQDNTGNPVYEFPDTNDGETLTIRSGDNITFENTGTHLIIHAGDITSTNYTPPVSTNGGSTELYTGVEGSVFQTVTTLGFRNSATGITWNKMDFEGSTAYISGSPSSGYLPLGTASTNSNHAAGKRLRILGSATTGINTSLSTTVFNEDFTISLSNTINVKKVAEKGPTYSGLVLSGGNPTTGGDGRDSFKLIDTPNSSRTGTNSSIVMNGWNNSSVISYPDTTRRSWSSAGSEFVSLHADTTIYHPPTGELYTLPFRFFEIIVDKLTVANLTVDVAAKSTEFLGNVIGFGNSDGYTTGSATVVFRNNTTASFLASASGEDGILLNFYDDTATATSPNSYIYRPADGYSVNLPESSFIMSDYLSFGNSGNSTLFSPTLSRNDANGIKVANLAGSSNEFHITANGAGYAKFGISSGSSGNAYMQFNNGTTTSSFQLKANAVLDVDTLTIGNNSSGYVFESTTFADTTSDRGKVLTIASVSTGKATVESRYIIKPLGDGTSVGSDPINTLYYVV